ncbi:MAG: non-canonical purine NTP pyrophosphatase [Fimbriiglobus sp.]
MPKLVLGSRNKKKLGELVGLLGDLPLELTDLTPYPNAPEVDETGDTFEANARLKATITAQALGEWVLGEDSGLVVPSLGGAPGIFSARYAGEHGNDLANNAKLLTELTGKTGDSRRAYYVSTAALANPKGEVVALVAGKCWGIILEARRGEGGFGYDPLFLIPEYHATFGELSPVVKQALSHRGRAVGILRPLVRKWVLGE